MSAGEDFIVDYEQWKEINQKSHLMASDIVYELWYGREYKEEVPKPPSIDPEVKKEADKLSHKTAEEYAHHILSLPPSQALSIISHTSPLLVEHLAAVKRMQDSKGAGETLVSLMRMIHAIETYELKYLSNVVNKIPFIDGEWSPPLIDVWDNYDTFVLQPVSKEEEQIGKIHFGDKPQRVPTTPNTYSVSSEEEFKKSFAIFTNKQFEGWNEWDNMVVIGGSVVASMLPVPIADVAEYYHNIAYTSSDIDVYFYGLSSAKIATKIGRLYEHLKKVNGGDVLVVRTELTITFCSAWPNRHIQIVMGTWDDIPSIIFEPDIDCTCVVFNGNRLLATQRSRFSLNHRAIIASEKRYSARGFPEYEKRLLKYSQRGFYIWDTVMTADFSNVSLRYLLYGKDRLAEHMKIEGRAKVYGLRLLLIGYFWPLTMQGLGIRFFTSNTTDHRFKDEGLPYGPTWGTEKIRVHLKKPVFEDSSYGAFEATSAFQCINKQDIKDWQALMPPHRVSLTSSGRELGFHSYIFLDHDQLEIDKLTEGDGYCRGCYRQIPVGFMTCLYPHSRAVCTNCFNANEDLPSDSITVVEDYQKNIKLIRAPSAYHLYRARLTTANNSNGKLSYDYIVSDTTTTHHSSLYNDCLKQEGKYNPSFLLSIGESSYIEEGRYQEFMFPPSIMAVISGDVNEVKRCISQHHYSGPIGKDGRTPLAVASERGDLDMVKCILELKAAVDEQTGTGWTPLLCALDKNHTAVVDLLLKHKAQIHLSQEALKYTRCNNKRELQQKLKELKLKNK